MPNTPDKRPDVERIKARLKATQDEGGATEGITVDPELWHDAEALIAYIEALEARQEKLEAVVKLVRDGWMTGQHGDTPLDKALAALDGGGDG